MFRTLPCLLALLCVRLSAQTVQLAAVPDGMEVKVDGKLFTRYVTDVGTGNKPYFWPVIGPTGDEMTRAYPMEKREGEAQDHPHHRSMNFGHEDIGGFNSWHERATFAEGNKKPEETAKKEASLATIRHRSFRDVKAEGSTGSFLAISDHVRPDGSVVLTEETRYTFRATPAARSVDVDMDLIATNGDLKIKDIKDAGFSVRVAHSLAVDSKQGGRIVNAEGDENAAAWGTRSDWVDYTGPVNGKTVGVAMFDHPTSFRHPTPWHVRTYGLFTANPFGLKSVDKTKKAEDGTFVLAAKERLGLRYRVIFHEGDTKSAGIAEAYAAYAKEEKK
jgi:hypothetical protein